MKNEHLSDEELASREKRYAEKLRRSALEGDLGSHGLTNVVQLILLRNAERHDAEAKKFENQKIPRLV